MSAGPIDGCELKPAGCTSEDGSQSAVHRECSRQVVLLTVSPVFRQFAQGKLCSPSATQFDVGMQHRVQKAKRFLKGAQCLVSKEPALTRDVELVIVR